MASTSLLSSPCFSALYSGAGLAEGEGSAVPSSIVTEGSLDSVSSGYARPIISRAAV